MTRNEQLQNEFITIVSQIRALRLLNPRDRETARIYDDDGYCLYR